MLAPAKVLPSRTVSWLTRKALVAAISSPLVVKLRRAVTKSSSIVVAGTPMTVFSLELMRVELCCCSCCLSTHTPCTLRLRAARSRPAYAQSSSTLLYCGIPRGTQKKRQRGSDNFSWHQSVIQRQNRSSNKEMKGCQPKLADN